MVHKTKCLTYNKEQSENPRKENSLSPPIGLEND